MGNATKNFAVMVVFKELIESAIKKRLLEDNLGFKKAGSIKKNEGKAQALHVRFQPSYAFYPFYPDYASYYPSFNNMALNPYVYYH